MPKRTKKWRPKTVTTPRFLPAQFRVREPGFLLPATCLPFASLPVCSSFPPAIATSASEKLKPTDRVCSYFRNGLGT